MKTAIIDAFSRAFGIFVFAVVSLWIGRKAFPGNWPALVALYIMCIPLAALYGWLVGPQSDGAAYAGKRRVPGLLIIGAAVLVAIAGYAVFKVKIDAVFFGSKSMTSNITLVPTRKSEALLLAAQRGRWAS